MTNLYVHHILTDIGLVATDLWSSSPIFSDVSVFMVFSGSLTFGHYFLALITAFNSAVLHLDDEKLSFDDLNPEIED